MFHWQRIGMDLDRNIFDANKEFIAQYLSNDYEFNLKDGKTLLFDAETGYIERNDESKVSWNVSWMECSRRIIKWTKGPSETGLDRFWFDLNETEKKLYLYGLQLNLGKDSATITAGNLRGQRSERRVCDCVDSSIAGILCKAERGLHNLLLALQPCLPVDWMIEVEAIHIVTNKEASNGFTEFLKQTRGDENDPQFTIKDEIVSELNIASNVVNVRLIEGSEWIKKIMPEKLVTFV
jgi:hypothetical protein